MALNPQQQEALTFLDGPVLIIAGPGSGKTHTLVERVVCLIQKGVAPEEIFVATFTEKAAKELITRVSNRLLELGISANLNEMYIGTLHSIFLRILEEHREYTRLKKNYRLFDEFDQAFFIYRNINRFYAISNLEELVGENTRNRWQVSLKLAEKVNVVSEEVLDVEKMEVSTRGDVRALAQCYKIYQEILVEENALDFSTIQFETLQLLQNHIEVLHALQDSIQYFMVDEYQDTNTVQEQILLLLTSKNNNLCVVGDDDQGLYRFRGATIRNILEFADNYPAGQCHKIYLETNYRSHPQIIDFYNKWMTGQDWNDKGKHFRFDKTIVPHPSDFPDTKTVVKVSSDGEREDYYKEVVDFIETLQKKNVVTDLNQIAFLARSVRGDQIIGLTDYLEKHGIRVFSPRSELFFKREEIQMVLGCIISVFPTLYESMGEYNERFKAVCERWQEAFEQKVGENPQDNKHLIRWVIQKQKEHLMMHNNTNYAFTGLIYQMLQFELFAKFLDTDLHGNKTDLRPAYNLGILTGIVSKFEFLYNITIFTPNNRDKTLKAFFGDYLKFVYDGGIGEYENFDENIPSGCISFMTIHQSKGLEFPITMVDSLYAVPRKDYSSLDEELQKSFYHKPVYEPIEKTKYYDFWRLYYTAFSRAQNLLVLTGHEHSGPAALPSREFCDIWNQTPSWRSSVFDMTKLKLATVHAANIKHEYSFTSHILLYEACPLQYKFYKELEFVAVRMGGSLGGSLLHQTIEDIHKAVLRGERDTLTDANIISWFNMNYILLSQQQRTYLRQAQQDALLRQVLRYRDDNSDKWDSIMEAEVDVSLVKEDYILEGKIDLVQGENGTVELVDFKSGDKPDVNTRDERQKAVLNQYRRQLEIYAYLIHERTGQTVTKMHLYYPKVEDGNPRITFNYQSHNIETTISSFEDVVKKIEKKDFSMEGIRKSEKHCSDCDMRFYCNNRK